jgi:hypothetical protein
MERKREKEISERERERECVCVYVCVQEKSSREEEKRVEELSTKARDSCRTHTLSAHRMCLFDSVDFRYALLLF